MNNSSNKIRNIVLSMILIIAAGVVGYFIGKGTLFNQGASLYDNRAIDSKLVVNNSSSGPAIYSAWANIWCDFTGGNYDYYNYPGVEGGWYCRYGLVIKNPGSYNVSMVSSADTVSYKNACSDMGGVVGKDSSSCMVSSSSPKFIALAKSYADKNFTAQQKKAIETIDSLGIKPTNGTTPVDSAQQKKAVEALGTLGLKAAGSTDPLSIGFWAWFYCDITGWGTWAQNMDGTKVCLHIKVPSTTQNATR